MSGLARWRAAWRRFGREDGSVTIEAVIMVPTLILFYITSFSFFDAYRTQTVLTKSGYVVGDLLSRETGTVRPADIAGLRGMFAFLTFSPDTPDRRTTELRVSEIWREVDAAAGIDRHVVVWTHGTGGMAGLDADELADIVLDMPRLAPNDRVTAVETFIAYRPPFFVGLPAYRMETLVLTRQRYSGQLCFVPAGGGSTCA